MLHCIPGQMTDHKERTFSHQGSHGYNITNHRQCQDFILWHLMAKRQGPQCGLSFTYVFHVRQCGQAPPLLSWTSDGQSCPATILMYIWQLSTRLGCSCTCLYIVAYQKNMFNHHLHFLAELTLVDTGKGELC
jgi:hypothetical protein